MTAITAKFLMCPPDYYTNINYEINPWMKKGTICDNASAKDAWEQLRNALTSLKAKVFTMPPHHNQPDIVFTANAALVYKNTAVTSRFRHTERRPEEFFYADWLKSQKYSLEYIPEYMSFEGEGDALFAGENLYSGYITRTDIAAHTYIAYLLNIRIISLELIDERFYHLDTCFCPLEDGYLMYYPKAFDEYGNRIIEHNFHKNKLIPVKEDEALGFCCNAVNIGNKIIMNKTSDRLKNVLAQRDFDIIEIDFSEFIKAGGSAKCLCLRLS